MADKLGVTQGFREEFRKVQLTGRSSYVVSLPKRWAKSLGLKPGDAVAIRVQEDSSLLISARGAAPSSAGLQLGEVRLMKAGGDLQSLARKVISLYLVGHNLIHVAPAMGALSPRERGLIKQMVQRKLIGAEVVEDSPKVVSVQVLASYPGLTVEDALRRMFSLALAMQRDVISGLKNLDMELLDSVLRTDDEVDRFSLYIVRQLKRAVSDERLIKEIGLRNAKECLGYRLAVKAVERVADHSVRMSESILALEKPLDVELHSRIERLGSMADRLFEDAMLSLFKRDYRAADETISKADMFPVMEKEAVELLLSSGLSAKEVSNLRLVIESTRRIAEYSEDIAEVTLNRTVEETL